MTDINSERLIVKFITNQANLKEIEMLTKWLEDVDNRKVFKDFVKANYAIDYAMSTFSAADVKNHFAQKIKQEKSILFKRKIKSYYKYAAIIILCLGSFYFYQKNNSQIQNDNLLVVKEESITLELENGSLQTINPSNSTNITDLLGKVIGKQDKSKITYSDNNTIEKLVYNTLKIPYGKRFELELSDGTIVYLNSGSSLKYPVKFLKNQNRQVFVTGEAYFEVAKDKLHPFTVNTEEMNIEVLGTKFNVNSYADELSTDVVLVEGKVALYNGTKIKTDLVELIPGLKGSILKGEKDITTEKVNINPYTAWVEGKLVFRNISFNAIIKRLERHYNVTFVNNNKTLGTEIFSASFKDESIQEVLKYLSDSYAIDYTVKDNKIIIE